MKKYLAKALTKTIDLLNDATGYLDRKADILEKKYLFKNRPHALPMNFNNYFSINDEYTWDDYYKEYKKKHPIKYKIHKARSNISIKYRIYISDPLYNLNSLLHEDHKIDLRGTVLSEDTKPYKGGYINPCDVLYASIYKSFMRYIKELESFQGKNLDDFVKEVQENKDGFYDKSSINYFIEVKLIRDFFENDIILFRTLDYDILKSLKYAKPEIEKQYRKNYNSFTDLINIEIENKLKRVVELRPKFWT